LAALNRRARLDGCRVITISLSATAQPRSVLRASHCAAVFSAAGELGEHGLAAELGQLRLDLRKPFPASSNPRGRTPVNDTPRAGILKQFRVFPGRRLFHCRRPWPRASCAGSSPPSAPPGTPTRPSRPVSKRGLAHVCDPVALAGYQDAREAAR
jgi:hypothetical protein